MKKLEFNSNDLVGLFELLKTSASLLVTSPDGTITYVNENYCDISGYSREEIIGKNPRIFNSNFHDYGFFNELWKTVTCGQVWRGQICNKKKDGTLIWLDTIIGPIYDDQNVIEKFIVVRFDVTSEQQLECLAREQSVQLSANSKMVTLGEMASGIAHEINNPLAVISGKASKLIRAAGDSTFTTENMLIELNKIQQGTHRITKIINGLRRFSRNAENDQLEPILIQEFIEDAITLCSEKFKDSSVELRLDSEIDTAIQISGRACELSQVLINLLQNSCDAVESLSEKWVEVTVDSNEEFVHVRVTDSGPGISPEILNRIMQPFFTTKIVGKGTGLGLSISSDIILKHKGELYYEKSSAHTQFVIKIPLEKKVL